MRRLNRKPEDKKMFTCPQCDKPRMVRSMDHIISLEKIPYTTKDNEEIELLVDICDPCRRRNVRKYFEPSKADIRRVLRTLKEDAKLAEGQSLEDLL